MFMIKKKNCIYHAWLILNLIIINDENERFIQIDPILYKTS